MNQSVTIIVYADINCPFCYVLHERLINLGLIESVEWRPIEHAPGALKDGNNPQKLALLNEEYGLVRQRAPDIECENPHLVPNTNLINRYLIAISEQYPEKAFLFRRNTYLALWQDGKDIENEDVIKQILADIGISQVRFKPSQITHLEKWQNEWLFGDFDTRIPSQMRNDGELLLGLQNAETLTKFITFGLYKEDSPNSTCRYFEEEELFILSGTSLPKLMQTMNLGARYKLSCFDNVSALLTQFKVAPPEAVILNTDLPSIISDCQKIKNEHNGANVPVIFAAMENARELESDAFNVGATDFLCFPEQSSTFLSRLKVHLRNKKRLDILSEHANKDSLTGLNNRREFDNQLERNWRKACRFRQNLGLIFLDVNYFKQYNDLCGHQKGDEALVSIANAIAESLHRPEDFCARYSGEEFVILLPNLEQKDIVKVACEVKDNFIQLGLDYGSEYSDERLTVSIGICVTKVHADNNSKMLIERADLALNEAKKFGANKIQVEILEPPH